MNENKRFDLTEWLENKKNRRKAVVYVIVVFFIMLFIRIMADTDSFSAERGLEDGKMLTEKGKRVEKKVPDYLDSSYSREHLGVSIAVPSIAEENFMLNGSLGFLMDDVYYQVDVCSESKDAGYLLGLVSLDVFPLIKGFRTIEEKPILLKTQKGYLGDLPVEYGMTLVELAGNRELLPDIINERVEVYSIVYVVDVEEVSGVFGEKLVLQAFCEEAAPLLEAQGVLKEIAYSLRALEPEKEADRREEGEELQTYPIDVYWTNEKFYTEPVMVIMWDNTNDHPIRLGVANHHGYMGEFLEEYSIGGHYVYKVSGSSDTTFHIKGETETPLVGATITMYEMEQYLDLYHYTEVHDDMDHIINRDDGDGVVE